MANSIIGALRVMLGMDAAEFTTGARRARQEASQIRQAFTGLEQSAVRSFTAMGAAIAAALGPAALGVAIRNSLTLADETYKLAQAVGLSTEQLTRYQYAAGLAGLGNEQFQKGLVKLSTALKEAGDPASEAARAFAQLGISTTSGAVANKDLAGVLELIAERYAATADGVNKTNNATALFGEKLTKMIPLLNGGKEGLKQLGDESDRVGRTLSTETAQAAERFNDTMEQVKQAHEAVTLGVVQRALPALQMYADKLKAAASDADFMRSAQERLAAVLEFIQRAVSGLALGWNRLGIEIGAAYAYLKEFFNFFGKTEDSMAAFERLREEMAKTDQMFAELKASNDRLWASVPEQAAKAAEEFKKPQMGALQSAEAFKSAMDKVRAELDEILAATSIGMAEKMAALDAALKRGTISYTQYGKMVRQVEKQNQEHVLDTASLAASTISSVFGKNKLAAIGSAIINTAVAITKAMQLPPPFSWAQAALIAATGAAQIATIQSASESGGGSVKAPAGGAGQAAAPAGDSGPQQGVFIQLNGDTFGREQIRGLIAGINDATKDGARLVLA
jgi:hypothetical protein